MLGVSNETGESQTHQIHQLTERRCLSFIIVSLPPFHRTSQRLFVVVVAVRYRKVLSGHCWMVLNRCRGRGRQHRPSPWWAITNRGGSGDDGGGGGRERRLYLFGNGCATNKQPMPNNRILVHSMEHSGLNSGMHKFHQNGGLSSAPPIPAGIRSFRWNSSGFRNLHRNVPRNGQERNSGGIVCLFVMYLC